MHKWRVGWALGAALAVAACAGTPGAQLGVKPVQVGTASLRLKLENPWRAARGVLHVAGSDKVKLTIDGPGQTAPFETTVTMAAGGTLVSLANVPAGPHRVVTLQALDGGDVAIPGSVMRATGELKSGANTLEVSTMTTAVGAVVAAVLAHDRAEKTSVLAKVDTGALSTAMAGYVRGLAVRHTSLLDTAAIASALIAADGTAPASSATFAQKPGRLVLRPANWPDNVGATVTVNDPVSFPVVGEAGAPLVIEPIAPGTWTLTVTPDKPGLAAQSQTVTIGADGTLSVNVGLGTAPVLKAALPMPLGAAAWGLLTVGATPTLVALGGTTYANTPDLAGGLSHNETVQLYAGTTWQTHLSGLAGLDSAAFAVHGNKLYTFGGSDGTGLLDTIRVFTPGTPGSMSAGGLLPMRLAGGSAATFGDTIYIAGGMAAVDLPSDDPSDFPSDAPSLGPTTAPGPTPTPAGGRRVAPTFNRDGLNGEDFVFASGTVFAYKPADETVEVIDEQALLPASQDYASAVAGGKWYFFGGHAYQTGYANGTFASVTAPTNQVTAYTPGTSAHWASRAEMPTARSGAAAVTVAGKIWVIGGAGYMGVPSRAVEVYDPASNTWTIKPPLNVGRAFPIVALMNGKILVAGGIQGETQNEAMPVASVEEITP